MAVYRAKLRWTGFTGAPGYTNLHFDAPTEPTSAGAQAVLDAAGGFMGDIASNLPAAVTVTLDSAVEVVDQTNNELITVLTGTPRLPGKGTVSGGFSSATGACITWDTGEVKNGRRVRGRTFIVPMAGGLYDTDGTLTSAAVADLQSAATVLAGGGFNFGILARPSSKGANDGSFHTVSSGRVADKTAMLRSRRD